MIIVEDGSAFANSNSYIAVADADAYWAARSNPTWGGFSTQVKEGALLESAQFLDGAFEFIGERRTVTQAMAWPRVAMWAKDNQLILSNVVPLKVKDAQCELALVCATLLASGDRLNPTLDRGGLVHSQTLGPLSIVYADGAPAERAFPFIEKLLRDYMTGSDISGCVVRG